MGVATSPSSPRLPRLTGEAPAAGDDLWLGKVLDGRFELVELIGIGGMARVYRAIQQPLGRLVAVKVLAPRAHHEGARFAERFVLEASVTSRLRHPNTITVIDHGRTADGVLFLVTEYLDGLTLQQMLSRTGAMPWRRAVDIAQQVARSVREAHRLGVLHRDLKPSNVMLSKDQEDGVDAVKVLDFGLAKILTPDAASIDPSASLSAIPGAVQVDDIDFSAPRLFIGTPRYTAPEQVRGSASAQTDVYSLGAVLYEMLTGTPPFQAEHTIDLIVQHLHHPVPPMPAGLVPPAIEAVVRQCLAKLPGERLDSMDALIHALKAAAVEAGDAAPPRSTTENVPRVTSGVPSDDAPTRFIEDLPLDISVEGARESHRQLPPVALFGTEPKPQRSKAMLLLPVVGALFAFVAVVLLLWPSAPSKPAAKKEEPPKPVAAPVAPAPAAAVAVAVPTTVRFSVDTVPRGAQVFKGKQLLGVTPTRFEVQASAEGDAIVELVVAKAGFHPVGVTAGGKGEVSIVQKLQKASQPLTTPKVTVPVPDPTPAPVVEPVVAAAPVVEPVVAPVAAVPTTVTMSSEVTRPELLSETPVIFPRGVPNGGPVVARCTITKAGAVEGCRLLKVPKGLDEAVSRSLAQRTYKPATLRGEAIDLQYVINFTLAPPR